MKLLALLSFGECLGLEDSYCSRSRKFSEHVFRDWIIRYLQWGQKTDVPRGWELDHPAPANFSCDKQSANRLWIHRCIARYILLGSASPVNLSGAAGLSRGWHDGCLVGLGTRPEALDFKISRRPRNGMLVLSKEKGIHQ